MVVQQDDKLTQDVDLRHFVQVLSPFEQARWRYDVATKSYAPVEHDNCLLADASQQSDLWLDRYEAARLRLLRNPAFTSSSVAADGVIRVKHVAFTVVGVD